MSFPFKSLLRDARYAFPDKLGRRFPIETSEQAAASCIRIAEATAARVTLGYFALPDEAPEQVADAFVRVARLLRLAPHVDAVLAVKAPPLAFDRGLLAMIVGQGVEVVIDALTYAQAPDAIALACEFDCGIALPARWKRSLADARVLRDAPCRIRLVKGEWPDPAGDCDVSANYLALVRTLAGRSAPVHVATHDPLLADAALTALRASETPVELGQLRGLPRRRTTAVAAHHGVSLRYYYPFGPGWWPYAIEQALRKPYLPLWALRERLGAR